MDFLTTASYWIGVATIPAIIAATFICTAFMVLTQEWIKKRFRILPHHKLYHQPPYLLTDELKLIDVYEDVYVSGDSRWYIIIKLRKGGLFFMDIPRVIAQRFKPRNFIELTRLADQKMEARKVYQRRKKMISEGLIVPSELLPDDAFAGLHLRSHSEYSEARKDLILWLQDYIGIGDPKLSTNYTSERRVCSFEDASGQRQRLVFSGNTDVVVLALKDGSFKIAGEVPEPKG